MRFILRNNGKRKKVLSMKLEDIFSFLKNQMIY